jgi:hypothetical protein
MSAPTYAAHNIDTYLTTACHSTAPDSAFLSAISIARTQAASRTSRGCPDRGYLVRTGVPLSASLVSETSMNDSRAGESRHYIRSRRCALYSALNVCEPHRFC